MGLLDELFSQRGSAGLLAFGQALAKAGGPSPYKGQQLGGLADALGAFSQGANGYDQQQFQKQFQGLQMKKLQSDIAENDQQTAMKKAAMEQQQRIQQLLSGNTAMTMGAQQGDIGPTMTNAQRIPQNPVDQYNGYASILERAGLVDQGMKYRQEATKLAPEIKDYMTVRGADGPQLVGLRKDGGAPIPVKGMTELTPNKAFNADGTPNMAYQQYEMGKAKAGATSVSVNTGQKGFDNELKLRSDFRSEPIYKAHQEVQSAYSQIQQSLKQKSPAGDLAGATKIMKLLDPGSVVRESELGMAMAASGMLDRVVNYASNILNGTKLTPKQREDFQTLADALYQESAKQYAAKQGEYSGIAKDYGLNSDRVAGKPITPGEITIGAYKIRMKE